MTEDVKIEQVELRWEKGSCSCKIGPLESEVVLDRNFTPRCPRCDHALGGDPVPDYVSAALAREPDPVRALEQRASDAEHRYFHFCQWHAAKSAALKKFIQDRAPDLWDDYAAVSVNGSLYGSESGYTMEPTFEREMNILRHRMESAEKRAVEAEAKLAALNPDTREIVEALLGTPINNDSRAELSSTLGRFGWLEAMASSLRDLCAESRNFRATWLGEDPEASFECEQEVDALIKAVRPLLLAALASIGAQP